VASMEMSFGSHLPSQLRKLRLIMPFEYKIEHLEEFEAPVPFDNWS
jgi:hypothetical protein